METNQILKSRIFLFGRRKTIGIGDAAPKQIIISALSRDEMDSFHWLFVFRLSSFGFWLFSAPKSLESFNFGKPKLFFVSARFSARFFRLSSFGGRKTACVNGPLHQHL